MQVRPAATLPLLLGLLSLVGVARGQSTVTFEGGARVAALGGAGTALPGQPWGVVNPAAWATLPGRTASFHAGQAFGLSALRLGALQYVEVSRWGAVGAGARTFGFEDFRASTFHLGYARGFRLGSTRAFYSGAMLTYHQLSLGGGYGSAGAVGLSIGGMARLLPSVHLGAVATNLNAPRPAGQAAIARTLAVGLAYEASERMTVLVDAFKDLDRPLSLRTGLELHPATALSVRAGAATGPTRYTAGAGLSTGRLRAAVSTERHQDLGWSPSVALTVRW